MTAYKTEFKTIALKSYAQAARIAEKNDDLKTASQAYGGLGQIREAENRFDEAEKWYAKAVFKAQQTYAPEIGYLWLWRLGRIGKARNDIVKALKHYADSIETVGPIRNEFFKGYRDHKHRNLFEEAIKPVYLEYAELLMTGTESLTDIREKREWLTTARDTLEAMKNELQDYYQDECVTELRTKGNRKLARVPEGVAVFYPVVFEKHSGVLLTLSDELRYFKVPIGKELSRHAAGFRRELELGEDSSYLAEKLYDWLIAPLESELVGNNITTLVIVPDGVLHRTQSRGQKRGCIPMACQRRGSRPDHVRILSSIENRDATGKGAPRGTKKTHCGYPLPESRILGIIFVDRELDAEERYVETNVGLSCPCCFDMFRKRDVRGKICSSACAGRPVASFNGRSETPEKGKGSNGVGPVCSTTH